MQPEEIACPQCGTLSPGRSSVCSACGQNLSPSAVTSDASGTPGLGSILGSYRLIEQVGEGGMGRVFVAKHVRLGRKVAIKLLHASYAKDSDTVARFFNEARAIHTIAHPNIVEILAAQDEPLGAVRRQTVTVLFVDIVGFTRTAEAMQPEAVVTLLRDFHERMTAQIFACGGTVEKYIGDAIMAVFGVPTASENDAANALICADMMLETLGRWNAERVQQGERPLGIGIGLNYGPAVLGDVGSEHSMSFTVIGDTINTASRLQGLTRTLETPLVVGGPLVDAIRGGSSETALALLDKLVDQGEHILRGRASPVRVWTLKVVPQMVEVVDTFSRATGN